MDAEINQCGFSIYWNGEWVARHNADVVGTALLWENIERFNRYVDQGTDNLPGPIPNPVPEHYVFLPFLGVDAARVLKAIDCYGYQSCEYPNWNASGAR